MGKTWKDKNKYLDKNNPETKKKPKYIPRTVKKQNLEDLLDNEDFLLGI